MNILYLHSIENSILWEEKYSFDNIVLLLLLNVYFKILPWVPIFWCSSPRDQFNRHTLMKWDPQLLWSCLYWECSKLLLYTSLTHKLLSIPCWPLIDWILIPWVHAKSWHITDKTYSDISNILEHWSNHLILRLPLAAGHISWQSFRSVASRQRQT